MKPRGWRRETDRDAQLFDRTVVTDGGCWEWQGYRSRKGYGEIKVDGRMEKAHRQAFLLRRGPIPQGMHVLHRCDNPPCVNPDHLFLGTNDDNVADRTAKGRSARNVGAAASTAKLTEDDVRQIRRMATLGMTNLEIAEAFPVNDRSISNIIRNKTWSHVA